MLTAKDETSGSTLKDSLNNLENRLTEWRVSQNLALQGLSP
jgi:hypothetical protein